MNLVNKVFYSREFDNLRIFTFSPMTFFFHLFIKRTYVENYIKKKKKKFKPENLPVGNITLITYKNFFHISSK